MNFAPKFLAFKIRIIQNNTSSYRFNRNYYQLNVQEKTQHYLMSMDSSIHLNLILAKIIYNFRYKSN